MRALAHLANLTGCSGKLIVPTKLISVQKSSRQFMHLIPRIKFGKICVGAGLGIATVLNTLIPVAQATPAPHPSKPHTVQLSAENSAVPQQASSQAEFLGDPVGYSLNGQHIVYRGEDGHIYELWFDRNEWKQTNLTKAANAPLAAGNPTGYSLGSLHVVYRGNDNHIHELWFDGDQWKHTDLTLEAQAPPAAGEPVGYVLESQHVLYRSSDGHIHELWFDADQWKHTNLTQEAQAPLAAGDPSGYSLGSLHVVYRGEDGHIHELWFAPDALNNKWRHEDLTEATKAPLAAGEPVGYVLKSLHVLYRGADGQIHELWFDTKAFNKKWRHSNLTEAAKAPLAAGDPTGYSLGSLHVVYRGNDNQIHELWFDNKGFNQEWEYTNLTEEAKAPPAAGDPSGYVLGSQHVVYRGEDGKIHELWFDNKAFNQRWKYANLTEEVNAPASETGQN
ncbi:hypothetical protein [Microcoleus sp. FACHB-68]|uniref:hypothetical protein n=1 Tax=Microcoleus sp. FACHB-68 TaxID=2692826 RepID=UPI001689A0A2|nr:hypothetical protein [Microcoleus sp. FACHB-68]